MITPVEDVKTNLVINYNTDDTFIGTLITAAVSYAEAYQHLPDGYYTNLKDGIIPEMSGRTKQAVIMLASNWYESRDGGTGGYFGDNSSIAEQSMTAIKALLMMDRDWKV